MDFELKRSPVPADGVEAPASPAAGFALSAAPLVGSEASEGADAGARPDTMTPTLCLMARDPHTLFAYWDVDWPAVFGEQEPLDRKVHLRIVDADRAEQSIEVEPMAGSCYVTVGSADAAYSGDLGFFDPASVWNSVATSDLISTPPEEIAGTADSEFATVPFHLSFQHMIDMLRSSRRDDVPLIARLANLRERARDTENADLTTEERELARVVEHADTMAPSPAQPQTSEVWRQQRLERILGFGATSPVGGFGGSSRAS